jgi:hypothetical protein
VVPSGQAVQRIPPAGRRSLAVLQYAPLPPRVIDLERVAIERIAVGPNDLQRCSTDAPNRCRFLGRGGFVLYHERRKLKLGFDEV